MSALELMPAGGQVTVRVAETVSRPGVDLDLVANANPLAALTATMTHAEAIAVAVGLLRACGIGDRQVQVTEGAVVVTIPRLLEGRLLIPDQQLPGSFDGRALQWSG